MFKVSKIFDVSQPLEKKDAIMSAITDLPKRRGLVTHINFSLVSMRGKMSSKIVDLSTKYGL